jgi:hypothetical protein
MQRILVQGREEISFPIKADDPYARILSEKI